MVETSQLITGSKQVALVNDQGQEIGSADVFATHRYPPQLHAASSVWLWRRANQITEILFQQRSQFKPIGANWWGNTVCGNVKPGESYPDCALRRLQAELGIAAETISLEPLYTFTYKTYGNETYGEYEFDQMFSATFTNLKTAFTPNPDEVSDTTWLPITELISWANTLNFPSISETVSSTWDELKLKTPPHSFTYQNRTYLIAPWIILMLRDQRLQQFFDKINMV